MYVCMYVCGDIYKLRAWGDYLRGQLGTGACLCVRVCIHMYVCMYVCMYAETYTNLGRGVSICAVNLAHVCTWIYIYIYICVCVCVCVCVCDIQKNRAKFDTHKAIYT